MADEIIEHAVEEYRKDPDRRGEIYEKAYLELHERLGMGSIGPATAAAGPLMNNKKRRLAELLDIAEEDRK